MCSGDRLINSVEPYIKYERHNIELNEVILLDGPTRRNWNKDTITS